MNRPEVLGPTMTREEAGLERHAELAKRKASLEAVDASLNLIEGDLLVDKAKRRRDESRLLREQLVAARNARRNAP